MKADILKNLVIAGVAAAALSSCAPIKTGFLNMTDRSSAMGAVSEFENHEAACEDGLEEGSILADGAGHAFLVRSECVSLEEPVLLNPEEIEVSPDGEEIKLGEEVFELKKEEPGSEESTEAGERSEEESREERVAEEPKLNVEEPRLNTETPKLNTEVPKTNTEVPKTNTEVPRESVEGRI